jgi:hypothetical protein
MFDEHIRDVPGEPMLARFVSETHTFPSFNCIAVKAHASIAAPSGGAVHGGKADTLGN